MAMPSSLVGWLQALRHKSGELRLGMYSAAYAKFPETLLAQHESSAKLQVAPPRYVLRWPEVTVTFELVAAEALPRHLEELVGRVRRVYAGEPDRRGQALISHLQHVRMGVQATVTPEIDPAAHAVSALSFAMAATRSCVWLESVLLDSHGRLLLGPKKQFDPAANWETGTVAAGGKAWWRIW